MAYNEQLADLVREALVEVPRVKETRMFSGVTFMVNGKMCVSIRARDIMCRIDPEIHDAAVEKNGCRTMRMKGRDLRGWVLVDEEVLKTRKALQYWVGLALDFNSRARPSKQAKRQRRKG
jgi:TfoX/Sxy family transcriptional regulator of competence genes